MTNTADTLRNSTLGKSLCRLANVGVLMHFKLLNPTICIMTRSLFFTFLACAASGGLWAQSAGTKPVSDKKLADFSIGEIISGDQVKLDDLSGKIVALEFWGRNCGPCLAAMPELATLDKRYKDKGLRLIGVHAQDGSDEEILEPVKKNKAKYSIARNGQSPISIEGIPHMFVFNGKGELVYHGHPAGGEAEKIIKKELRSLSATGNNTSDDGPFATNKNSAGPLVAERAWTSADGRTMVAALISVKDGTATFKRKDGKSFDLDLSKLSDSDRKLIEEAEKKAGGAGTDEKE